MPGFDNILWEALSGPQRALSVGTDRVRRFAPGFPLLMAFADVTDPALEDIAPFCTPGERLYCTGWTGAVPQGWNLDVEASVAAMEWRGGTPDVDPRAVQLGEEHVPAMLELFTTCKPGPFATRPMEIGEWYGVIDRGRLVAIAGERLDVGTKREVSGVCTLPECQGKGYARLLTERVIASQRARGLESFLHVFPGNTRAVKLYEHMGFATVREIPLRVVSRTAAR
jgi:GNAT superfamily N-acetyltransferase